MKKILAWTLIILSCTIVYAKELKEKTNIKIIGFQKYNNLKDISFLLNCSPIKRSVYFGLFDEMGYANNSALNDAISDACENEFSKQIPASLNGLMSLMTRHGLDKDEIELKDVDSNEVRYFHPDKIYNDDTLIGIGLSSNISVENIISNNYEDVILKMGIGDVVDGFGENYIYYDVLNLDRVRLAVRVEKYKNSERVFSEIIEAEIEEFIYNPDTKKIEKLVFDKRFLELINGKMSNK